MDKDLSFRPSDLTPGSLVRYFLPAYDLCNNNSATLGLIVSVHQRTKATQCGKEILVLSNDATLSKHFFEDTDYEYTWCLVSKP